MPDYLHPGVYVSELPTGSHTIQGASTSTACFIGEAESGRPYAPTLITSFTEFERRFGPLTARAGGDPPDMPLAAKQFFDNGGTRLHIVRTVGAGAASATGMIGGNIKVEAAGVGQWGSDLRVCLSRNSIDATRVDLGVEQRRPDGTYHEIESFSSLGFVAEEARFYANIVNQDSLYIHFPTDDEGHHYEAAPGSPAIETQIQLAGGTDGTGDAITVESLNKATESLGPIQDISILAVPGVYGDVLLANVVTWARERRDLFMILDAPGDPHNREPGDAQILAAKVYQQRVGDNDHVALYFPWIEVADPYTRATGATRYSPPSGFIAGLFARTDNDRGVWKAPAGTEATLMGAVGVAVDISDVDQDTLNPLGINAIRAFDAVGIVCWGARTQAATTSEYLYVPVWRLATFIRSSVFRGTQWAAFEPNDSPLWSALSARVSEFMVVQFRSGAFQGGVPRDAFFVVCDATNNTEATIAAGQVNIMVGFAPLKPAEFVILQIAQVTRGP